MRAPRASHLPVRDAGPYGRCVYACDNDVCDHQTVHIRFKSGLDVDFRLSAFSDAGAGRLTTIKGSLATVVCNGKVQRCVPHGCACACSCRL